MTLRTYFLLLLSAAGCFAFGQKEIYENPRFQELSGHHRTLAILPFKTYLTLENINGKQEQELAKREGYAVQAALESYFSPKNKRRKSYVDFQNVSRTNALLRQHDITYDNVDLFTTKQLCEILGVDGLISGHLNLSVLLSKGLPEGFNILEWFGVSSNYGRIGLKISDGESGKLLWKYEKEINRKTGKDTRELIEKMMRKASRKFPYESERKPRKNK